MTVNGEWALFGKKDKKMKKLLDTNE